jgi:N-acetylmuramoyl-L-alanine amidase
MIKPIFSIQEVLMRPSKRIELWKQQLAECQKAEDEDLVIISDVENVEEECPIATNLKEFLDWLNIQTVNRTIEYIFQHCTATRQDATVSAILNNWKRQGWINPGYHVILPTEGYTVLADLNSVSNGARGYNSKSIHISYIGGIDQNGKAFNNMTESQKKLMIAITKALKEKFPNAKVMLHNEVSNKACPSFNRTYWEKIYALS